MSEREIADAFENSLLNDTTPLSDNTDTSVIQAMGLTGQGIRSLAPFERGMPRSGAEPVDPALGETQVVPLGRWRGSLKRRRDLQAEVVRKRLNDPGAVMLVMAGTTYSNKSVWGVFWLYIKTNYFVFPRLKILIKKIRRK